jgi:uncharacterized membrane protein YdjX (TVP38/TMEM64 family)
MMSSVDRRISIRRTAVVLALCCIALFAAWRMGLLSLGDRQKLLAAVAHARSVPFSAPLFVAVFAVGAAAGVPATPLTLAGGVLFGARLGLVLNWTGELLAALLAFAAVRVTGLSARRRSQVVDATRELAPGRAARVLFRLRLVPIMPFALLNAGAAISGMTWRDFAGATGLGIVPITVIYTVSASALVAGVAGSGLRALLLAATSAAVLIGVSFLPIVARATDRIQR